MPISTGETFLIVIVVCRGIANSILHNFGHNRFTARAGFIRTPVPNLYKIKKRFEPFFSFSRLGSFCSLDEVII